MQRQIGTILLCLSGGCFLAVVFGVFGLMLGSMIHGFAIMIDPAGANGSLALTARQLPTLIAGALFPWGIGYLGLIAVVAGILGVMLRPD